MRMIAAVILSLSASMAFSALAAAAAEQTGGKSDERLSAEQEERSNGFAIASPDADASLRIAAPLAPTRLSLVLAPSAVHPGETVFIDVYLQETGQVPAGDDAATTKTANLDETNESRLAGTLAFTEAEGAGEEQYFVVNVPAGMRFETRAAIVTIAITGADGPLENSAVELRKANLLR